MNPYPSRPGPEQGGWLTTPTARTRSRRSWTRRWPVPLDQTTGFGQQPFFQGLKFISCILPRNKAAAQIKEIWLAQFLMFNISGPIFYFCFVQPVFVFIQNQFATLSNICLFTFVINYKNKQPRINSWCLDLKKPEILKEIVKRRVGNFENKYWTLILNNIIPIITGCTAQFFLSWIVILWIFNSKACNHINWSKIICYYIELEIV